MSLIRCPECGRDVSNKAEACPNCGSPILLKSGIVMVRFPVKQGKVFKNRCAVFNKKTNKLIVAGWMGETLSFICDEPTSIYVFAGGYFGKPEVVAMAGDRYEVGFRGINHIYISKVDTISGNRNAW